jgi:hypothetical protein
MRIRVRIDRVILDGVPLSAAQAPYVRAAIESELGRLFAERGVPHDRSGGLLRAGATPSLHPPEVRVTRNQPAATGRGIAGAVYRSLGALR